MSELAQSPVALFIFLITIATSLMAFSQGTRLMEAFILHPYSAVRQGRWHTLLTSGLIHANGSHLIFNMVSYYFFAFQLEMDFGHWQFAALYLVSLVVSDLPSTIKHRDDPEYRSLGASGAVTAVIFSFILFRPEARIGLFFIPIFVPAPLFAVLYVAFSYAMSKREHLSHINHTAHLAGAISGLVLTVMMDPAVVPRFIEHVRRML